MTIDTMSPLVCDFCGASDTGGSLTSYPCRTFSRPLVTGHGRTLVLTCACCEPLPALSPGDAMEEYVSLDAWYACPDCRPFLDTGDADGLLARSMQCVAASSTVPAGLLVKTVASAHLGYWRHRQPLN